VGRPRQPPLPAGGRQGEAEQAYRQAAAAGSAQAQSNLAILRSQQQSRQGEAAQAHREPEAEQAHREAPAVEIQQWPLTAAATALLLALPPAPPEGGPVPQPTQKEMGYLLGVSDAQDAVCLALKELIVRGAYRIQMGDTRFWRIGDVVLLPQQPPPLPWPLAKLDGVLRPHTPGYVAAVVKHACGARGLWAGGEKLAGELGSLPGTELTERGLAELRTGKGLRGLQNYLSSRRTASGDAWARTAEQHVQRLEGLPQESEHSPQTAARAAAAAGALALLVPASLASLARLRGRSRRRGGDLDLDFAYVSDGVAFDPFDAVGDLYDSALEGGWPTKAARTVGDLLGLEGKGEVDAVNIALDSMRGSIDFNRGLKTWRAYGGGSSGGWYG